MGEHRIKKGLDLPLAGAPEPTITDGPAMSRLALVGADHADTKPRLLVQLGDRVRRGQVLFEDRKKAGVRFTSPAAGTVQAIHRGERRAFRSLVVEVEESGGREDEVEYASLAEAARGAPKADAIRALMLEAGLWPALRTRPFSSVPAADAVPAAIFVTAIDSHPHAPEPGLALAGKEAAFVRGLEALATLSGGPTHLCRAPGSKLGDGAKGVSVESFSGPHPAGTPGLHIHLLAPAGRSRTVWHIGYADVAALGLLLETGRLDVERVIALSGPGVKRPRLVRTRLGASIETLIDGELGDGELRVVSGSALHGRVARGEVEGYLGRFDRQVTVLSEGRARDFLGWLGPGGGVFSVVPAFLSALAGGRRFPMSTTTNGSPRAMVPIGSYERVMPFDLMPTHLLRALVVGDLEWAEELGCLELDEEDLAPCTFVCPGKTDYGPALRAVLDSIQREG